MNKLWTAAPQTLHYDAEVAEQESQQTLHIAEEQLMSMAVQVKLFHDQIFQVSNSTIIGCMPSSKIIRLQCLISCRSRNKCPSWIYIVLWIGVRLEHFHIGLT
jgi:hypothetical protein